MGRPLKKYKLKKNKAKRSEIIFDKIEKNGLIDYDETAPSLKVPKKQTIDKLIYQDYSQSLCEWISHKNYKDSIYNYIVQKQISTCFEFTMIFEIGIEVGWNFKLMDDNLANILFKIPLINKISSYKLIKNEICMICQEQKHGFYALECAHRFCIDCYKTYIKLLMKENGSAVVKKTCPMQGCKV